MFKRKNLCLNKLTVLYIFLLTFYCFNMEKDSSFFNDPEQSHNRFIFDHDTYTLCYDDSDIEKTTIINLSQEQLQKLFLNSNLLKNSLLFNDHNNDIVVPSILIVPENIKTHHIDILLNGLNGSVKYFELRDWYTLFEAFDILTIENAELKEILLKKYDAIALYCYNSKVNLPKSPEFFQKFNKCQFERYKKLTLALLNNIFPQTLKHQSIPIPLDNWENPITSVALYKIKHIALSSDGRTLLFLAGKSAFIYIKNNNGEFSLVEEINCVSSAGLSPDGSTIMTRYNHDLKWYTLYNDKILEKKRGEIKIPNGPRYKDSYSCRNENGQVRGKYDGFQSVRDIPNIHLSENGRTALIKMPRQYPCIIKLDKKRTSAQHSYISKEIFDGAPDWYQQMVAMSADKTYVHLLYSNFDTVRKKDNQKYWIVIDHKKKNDIRFLNNNKGYLAKTIDESNNDVVDCICLDSHAHTILKIDGGKAYLALTHDQNQLTLKHDDDYLCSGAVSLNGDIAFTGGALGEVYIHSVNGEDNCICSIPSPESNPLGNAKRFNQHLNKFIPQNPQGIIALATNKNGRYIAVARTCGRIDYYENEAESIIADINSCSFNALDMLTLALDSRYKNSRPKNISTIYSDLPCWIQNFATKNLNVRTGWGPQATWNLVQNKNVPFKYKCEAVVPYIGGSIAVAIGGYYTLKKWMHG